MGHASSTHRGRLSNRVKVANKCSTSTVRDEPRGRASSAGSSQPGMAGENLEAGPDDEEHEEQVEEVLPAHPSREWGSSPTGGAPRWCRGGDESLHRRVAPQPLGHGYGDDEQHEADRWQPQQVEPLAPTDAHPRGMPSPGHRARRPGRGVDGQPPRWPRRRRPGPAAPRPTRVPPATVRMATTTLRAMIRPGVWAALS